MNRDDHNKISDSWVSEIFSPRMRGNLISVIATRFPQFGVMSNFFNQRNDSIFGYYKLNHF